MTTERFAEIMGEDREPDAFDAIKHKRSNREDLHVFLLLDSLLPGAENIVSSSQHDQFYLSVDPEKLAAVISEGQARELVACGVMYEEDLNSLSMFA